MTRATEFVTAGASHLRDYGVRRALRHVAGVGLFVCLAALFSSDRAPRDIVSSASALAFGDARRGADVVPFMPFGEVAYARTDAADDKPRRALDSSFALFDMGTPQAPALRSSLDASFALVATAAIDRNAMFARPGGDLSLAAAPLPPTIFDAALPRVKPLVPRSPRVEVASIAPGAGEQQLRTKTLDLEVADGLPRRYPLGSAPYLDIIKREAKANGLPLWVPLGVIWVESKYNPKLRGSHGVLGMMQVMPSTARSMGYKGTNEQLLEAETNIIWGMKELGKDYKLADGDLCMTIAKYTGGFMTKRVRPAAQKYCSEVRRVTAMN